MGKVVFGLMLALVLVACTAEKPEQGQIGTIESGVGDMKLWSNDFRNGEMIPSKFTCQGENINPHLAWSDAPNGTKSFALVLDDPDAPSGLFVHWAVKDIPAGVNEIKQNSAAGKQLPNDYGVGQYKGPCPPALHRYFFRLYALNVEELSAGTYEELYEQVKENAIAKAELMGKYKKS